MKSFRSTLENSSWSEESVPGELFERPQGLSKNGLKAYRCNITLTERNLDRETIRKADFIHLVPSGVVTAAALQTKGFVYLRVA